MDIMDSINCTLLIDDDEVSNYLSKNLLSKFIITNGIKTFSSGMEALQFIVNYDPDLNSCPELIFLDIKMPVMDGFEFMDSFKQLTFLNKEKVKVVMLTNSYNEDDMKRCKDYGVLDYINKPLTEEKIKTLIEKISAHV
jgi:CheY-like chemotaxis protein